MNAHALLHGKRKPKVIEIGLKADDLWWLAWGLAGKSLTHAPIKIGNGADAPQDYQRGYYGRLIDYCLGDVRSTLHLLRYIERAGGIIDPRNPENFLNVQVPR